MQHQCLNDSILSQLAEGRLPEPVLSLALIQLGVCENCRTRFQDSLNNSSRELSGVISETFVLDEVPSEILQIPKLSEISDNIAHHHEVNDGRFNHFHVLRQISQGMNARVLEASDPRLNRKVAIKVLEREFARSDPAQVKQFLDEARTVAQINHPAIVPIFDVGTFDEQPYIVMPLLKGESLRVRLERGPIDPSESIHLALQLLDGLKAAHEFGVIHKDLKPENLWLIPNRSGTRDLVILDFGNSQLADTLVASTAGTPLYVSPEQVMQGIVDARTDFFALGTVLQEMLTGKPAWGRACEEELSRPSRDPGIPAPLVPVLEKLLTLDPADRYSSHSELKHDLLLTLKKYEKKRNLKLVAVLAGSFLIGFLGAFIAFYPNRYMSLQTAGASLPQKASGKSEPAKGKATSQTQSVKPVAQYQARPGSVFAASEQGLLVVNDAGDGRISVLDTQNDFARVAVLAGTESDRKAWISPNGRNVASLGHVGSSAFELKVWQLPIEPTTSPVEPRWVLPLNRKAVFDATLMERDGRLCLAVSTDEWAIQFYRFPLDGSGKLEQFSIKYDYSQIMRLISHPDGKLLVGTKEMGGIDIFDIVARKQIYSFRAFDSGPADASWGPDRNRLSTIRHSFDMNIYDLRDAVPATSTGRGYLRLQTAYEAPYRIDQAVFMDMERLLVRTATSPNGLFIYDLRINKFTHILDTEHEAPKSVAKLSENRAATVASSGLILIFDFSKALSKPR